MPKSANTSPTPAEFTALRAYLTSNGIQATDLNTAVGATVSSRTRQQIATQLIAYLRTLKKTKAQQVGALQSNPKPQYLPKPHATPARRAPKTQQKLKTPGAIAQETLQKKPKKAPDPPRAGNPGRKK